MKHRKTIFAAVAAAALGIASSAQALVVGGSVLIDIYSYDAGGVSANADATVANVDAQAATTAQVIYTGLLDFETTGPNTSTVHDFLVSGGGSYNLISGSTAGLLTSGGFSTTSLFDFQAIALNDFSGTITHDDGVSMFDDGVQTTAAACAPPTTPDTCAYSMTTGGFRLIYAAANGNPEVLKVEGDGSLAVPLPAGIWLMGTALAGFGIARRRRRA